MHTHAKKKKKKRNINPKRCTIEKYKFKTKFAQKIGNKTIYKILYHKSDDINDIMKIFWEFIPGLRTRTRTRTRKIKISELELELELEKSLWSLSSFNE